MRLAAADVAEFALAVAELALAVAEFALLVACVLAVLALAAAAFCDVVADAASTMRSYLAELVFVVSGSEPEDVCASLTKKMLFVPLSLTISRTT